MSRENRRVLVVDDDASQRRAFGVFLEEGGLRFSEADAGESALAFLKEHCDDIDCVVLDVRLPGIDGYEVQKRMRADLRMRDIPIIFVSAQNAGDAEVVAAIGAGALDHVTKPYNAAILAAKVKAACQSRYRARATVRELRIALEHATLDPLTGLYNRRELDRRLREEIAQVRRHQRAFAIVMIDLDHFKAVNDTFGHEEGDKVLAHVAKVARGMLREEDMAFRYGGEEFLLLLRACSGESAIQVSERIRKALKSQPLVLGGAPRMVTFSAGVASAEPANEHNTTDLVVRADAALYRAKREGRDRTLLEA